MTIKEDKLTQYLPARSCPVRLSQFVRRQASVEVKDVVTAHLRTDRPEIHTAASFDPILPSCNRAPSGLKGLGVWTPKTVDERTKTDKASAAAFRRLSPIITR